MGTPHQLRNSDGDSRRSFWRLKFVPQFRLLLNVFKLKQVAFNLGTFGVYKWHFGTFQGFFFMQQLFPSLLYCIGLYLGIVDKFTFLLNSLKMQFNQRYVPKEPSLQVNKRTKHIHYNQALPQNCSPFSDCPAALETLLQRERVEKFPHETEQTVKYLYSKGN